MTDGTPWSHQTKARYDATVYAEGRTEVGFRWWHGCQENRGGNGLEGTVGKLKVLFLPAWYPRQDNPVGGVFVREHARAASLHNEVVVIYVYADEAMPSWRRCQTTEEVEDGIRTIRVRYGKYRAVSACLKRTMFRGRTGAPVVRNLSPKRGRVIRGVKEILTIDGLVLGNVLHVWRVCSACRQVLRAGWKPDIIHTHVFTAGLPAIILGRLYGIPVVITEHWTAFQTHEVGYFDAIRARLVMRSAQRLLPVSDALRRAIQDYGIRGVFRVVPNAVDTELFCPPSTQRESDGRKRLLLVAILGPRKGIPYLLEALSVVKRRRRDFVLDIVGDGEQKAECEQLAIGLGLDDNVVFHGRQPEVHSFMRSCDFFVMPSLFENFGVVYIEAMACGKPVIASNIPGPDEFISDEVGVLVPPRDVPALSQAIDHMLDHCADYSSGDIARYARERFGYEAVGRLLDDVYREVTVRPTKAGAD